MQVKIIVNKNAQVRKHAQLELEWRFVWNAYNTCAYLTPQER